MCSIGFTSLNGVKVTLLMVIVAVTCSVQTSADETQILPTFYGRKCRSEQTIQEREDASDVVISGRVKAIHRNPYNTSYYCTIHIYRVLKGENIVSDILKLPTDINSLYRKNIDIAGFGNNAFCDSEVRHSDTRIFLASHSLYGYPAQLSLSSSLIRVGVRTLKRHDMIAKDTDESEKEAGPMLTECKYFFCSFYAVCKLGRLTGDPYCECPNCENELPQQVCGSDGHWYDNDCEVRKTACLRRKRIKSGHPRWCEMKEGSSSTTPKTVPTENTEPELNTTTTTFTIENSIMTKSTTATITTAKVNPCLFEECNYGAICKVSIDGLQARCQCPEICEDYGDSIVSIPVCGTDGKDYVNECELRKKSCTEMTNTTVDKFGKCEPCADVICPGPGQICVIGEFNTAVCECSTQCDDLSTKVPVCGTDGRTYDNQCILNYAACLRQDSQPAITVAYEGRCKFKTNPCESISCENYATCRVNDDGTPTCKCPEECPLTRSPVCGSNNVDYTNLCRLQQDACAMQTNITAVANQPCSEDPCLNYKCENDGMCEMLPVVVGGPLVPTCICPMCTAVLDIVCGSDGVTYSNLCSLKRDNCLKKTNVQVSNFGSCGPCFGKACEFGVCLDSTGTCVCPVDEDCVDSHSPVCADGKTYPSRCQLKLEACRQQKQIVNVTDGACDGNQCTRKEPCKYKAVCLGSGCLCNFGCDNNQEELVCGSNGKTYKNRCFLDKESCYQQTPITVVPESECDDKMGGGVDKVKPETGNGGGGDSGIPGPKPVGVVSTTESVACNMDTNCKYEGRCDYTNNPQGLCRCVGFFKFCEDNDPVACGSDGVVYKNLCELREKQCSTQKEIIPKPEEFCATEVNTQSTGSPVTAVTSAPLCPDSQTPLIDAEDKVVNCSSCLPNNVGQCSACLTDISYCNPDTAACCPKAQSLPGCTYTEFGCCPDNSSLPSPGPDHRGCPYTCECHEFGSNGPLCNALNFQCDCKLGVFGKTCDQCKLGWYGLRFIQTEGTDGCLPCLCNEWGSVRPDCEQDRGRCLCKTGVTGLKCNMCVEEDMVLTEDGCIKTMGGLTDTSEPDLCDTKDCGNGRCVVTDAKATCTCEYDCPEKVELVCGSDGQTYPNLCYLRRKACQSGDNIDFDKGECEIPTTTPISDWLSTTQVFPPSTTESEAFWGWFGRGGNGFLADEAWQAEKSSSTPTTRSDEVTCEDNPCLHSGTCVLDDELGIACICSVHWQGARCEIGNEFSYPSFHGNSFMRYIWNKDSTSFDFRLTIIPTKDTGVILFSGDATGRGDYISLVLNGGFLEFRFDTGGGRVTLKSEVRLDTNRRYSITAKRTNRDGLLSVSGQTPVSGQAPGKLTSLDVEPTIIIGQATNLFKEKLPKRLLKNLGGVKEGFHGCLYMIHDADAHKNKNFLLINSRDAAIVDGRNIGQCKSDPCLDAPCLNNGVCTMIDAFNYKCDCVGMSRGKNCASKSKKARDLLGGRGVAPLDSNVVSDRSKEGGKVFELPRFTGSSYLLYRLTSEVDYTFDVDMVFTTDIADGVLLFGGRSTDTTITGDFILLSIEDYVPVLRIDLGSGPSVLRLDERILEKDWNMISLRRKGQEMSLSLNGRPSKNMTSLGEMKYLNINDHITLGAIPHHLEHSRDYLHSPGLHGVIQRVSINGDDVQNFFDSRHARYKVKTYHGLPCHPNPCGSHTMCVPLLDRYRCDPM